MIFNTRKGHYVKSTRTIKDHGFYSVFIAVSCCKLVKNVRRNEFRVGTPSVTVSNPTSFCFENGSVHVSRFSVSHFYGACAKRV